MKRLEVTIESKHCAHVRGYGSRDLLTELRGRPPIWATLARAWVTTERTALDLVAVAESRGYVVELVGATSRGQGEPSGVPSGEARGKQPDPGRGLW